MASSRLPGKVMLDICGLPMLERVRQQALKAKYVSEVYIATCDDVIEEFFSHQKKTTVIRTSDAHKSGTSRCAEAIKKISNKYTHLVLVQGDEPLINPDHIDQFIESIKIDNDGFAWNAVSDCEGDDVADISVVKAAISRTQKIMYCFRVPPFLDIKKDHAGVVKKMQGLMAFTTEYLIELCNSDVGIIELTESIEQMRILERGDSLTGINLPISKPSVNTEADLIKVINILKSPIKKRNW